jgi:hypothetical protein
MNCKVQRLGGNQYRVTSGDEMRTIDLDGFTVMSDDDYNKLYSLNLVAEDMTSPQHSEGDEMWEAAVTIVANYSGFNADMYIAEHR